MARVISLRMVMSDTNDTGHSAVGMAVVFADIVGADNRQIAVALASMLPGMVEGVSEEVDFQVSQREKVSGDTATTDAAELDA